MGYKSFLREPWGVAAEVCGTGDEMLEVEEIAAEDCDNVKEPVSRLVPDSLLECVLGAAHWDLITVPSMEVEPTEFRREYSPLHVRCRRLNTASRFQKKNKSCQRLQRSLSQVGWDKLLQSPAIEKSSQS